MSQNSFFFVCAKGKAICGNTVTHGRSFLNICIQPECLYSLPSSVKLRHLFYNRKEKKCVWSIGGIQRFCLPLWGRSTRNTVTLEGPQLCEVSCISLKPFPGPVPLSLSPRTLPVVTFFQFSKPCLITFVKSLYLSKPNSPGFRHPWSTNNKHYLPQILRIK